MAARGPSVWILVIEILTIFSGWYLELSTCQIFTSGQFRSLQGPISHASQQNNILQQSVPRSSATIFAGSIDKQSPMTSLFQGQPHADQWTKSLTNGRDESVNTGRWLDGSASLTALNSFQSQQSAFSQQSANNLVRSSSFPVSNNFPSQQAAVGRQNVFSPVRSSSSVVSNDFQFNHGVVGQQVNIDSRSNSLVFSNNVQSQQVLTGQQSNSNPSPSAHNFHPSGQRNLLSARAHIFQNVNHPLRGTHNAMQNSLPRQQTARSEISPHVPNIISANKSVQQSQLLNAPHSQRVWSQSVGQRVINQNIRGNTQNLRNHINIPDVQKLAQAIQQQQTAETSNRLLSPINHASNTAGIDPRLSIQQNTDITSMPRPSEHTRIVTRNETFRSPGRNIEIVSKDGNMGNTVMERRVINNFRSNAVQVPTIQTMPQLPSDLNNRAALSSPVRLAQTLTFDMSVGQSGTQNIQGGVNGQLLHIGKEIQRPTQWIESLNPLSIPRESSLSPPNFANRNAPFSITKDGIFLSSNGISVQDHHASGLSLGEVSLPRRHIIQPTVTASSIVKDLSGNSFQTGGVPINIFGNPAVPSWLNIGGGNVWPGLPFMGESPDSPDIPDSPNKENENENENQQTTATTTKVPPTIKSSEKNEIQQIQVLHRKPTTPTPSITKERVIKLWTPMPLTSKMLEDLVHVPVMHTEQHVIPSSDNKVNGSRLILFDFTKRATPLQVDSSIEQIRKISEQNALTDRKLDMSLFRTPSEFSDLTASNEANILQDTQQQVIADQKLEKGVTGTQLSSLNTGVTRVSMSNFLNMKESRHSDRTGAITRSEATVFTNHGSKDVLIPISDQQSPNFEGLNAKYPQVSGQANTETRSGMNSQPIHSIPNVENESGGSLSNETLNMRTDPISRITTKVRTMIEILSQLIHQNTNTLPTTGESTHNTTLPFTNKNPVKGGESSIIGVDTKSTGNISGNGSDQQTCSPFAKQFYCIGKDMFVNVPGVADWCIQKCRNDSCLRSVCDCSCSASNYDANNGQIYKNLNNSKQSLSDSSNVSDHLLEKGQLINVNPSKEKVSSNKETHNNNISNDLIKGMSSRNVAANLTIITPVDPNKKIVKRPLARRVNPLLRRKQDLRQKHFSTRRTSATTMPITIYTTEESPEVEGEEIEIEDLQTTTVQTIKVSGTTTAHSKTTIQDYYYDFTDAYYDYTTTPGYKTFATTSAFDIGFRKTMHTTSSLNEYYSTAEKHILNSQNKAGNGEWSPGKGMVTDSSGNNSTFLSDTSSPTRPQRLVSTNGTVSAEFNEKGQDPRGNGRNDNNRSQTHLRNDGRGGGKFNKPEHSQISTGEDGNNVRRANLRGEGLRFDRTTPSMRASDTGTDRWSSRQTTLTWSNNRNRWDSTQSVTTSSWNQGNLNDRQTRPPPWNRDAGNWGARTTTPTWRGRDNWRHGRVDIPPPDRKSSDSTWRNRSLRAFNSWNGRSDRSESWNLRRGGEGSFNAGGRNEAQDQWSNADSDRVWRDPQSSWSREQASWGWENDWRFLPSNDGRRNNNGRNLRDKWNGRTTTPPSSEGGEETKGTEGADKK